MANLSPAITFTADLTPASTIPFGPLTNSSTVGVLHPDQYQESPDQGRTEFSNRAATRSTFIPGLSAAENMVLQHEGTVTLYGLKAIYVRNNYCSNATSLGAAANPPAEQQLLTGELL